MFEVGEHVYVGYQGNCDIDGVITSIQDNEYFVEFETPGGGGCFSFDDSDLCRGCDTPKADCKCR